ncbi:MAG: NADH-quinone oxidoreductase subunit NuoE [Desulfobacterales bacterium]|nr:NADH-quinone oxidoreductase subunit NuoE [Desulfobacterales bacterium]
MLQQDVDWERLEAIIANHAQEKWGLIPLLQEIQETIGFIPPQAIEPVARALRMPAAGVQGVITFYAGFTLKPKGRCVLKVCRGTACHVKGSRSILRFLKKELNLEEGETSPDYQFTLETVACLGACFLAPTMMVNRDYFGRLSPTKINSVLGQYAKVPKEK